MARGRAFERGEHRAKETDAERVARLSALKTNLEKLAARRVNDIAHVIDLKSRMLNGEIPGDLVSLEKTLQSRNKCLNHALDRLRKIERDGFGVETH